MDKTEKIITEKASSLNGYITIQDCESLGFHKNTVFNMAKNKILVRLAPGIYALPDTIPDELFILHLRFPSVVFSHETALYYLGYSDQVPFQYSVTVPKGFHSTALKNYTVIQQKTDFIGQGKTEAETEYKNKIPVYCIERTLCDLLHKPGSLDLERFVPAFKKYISSKERNNIKLLDFAKKFGVEKKIRTYLEVSL
ncbi:MAG: type IV toxin-antitoxin system AbiEi family antitoxin domain-containing protein [Treponema sp.]